MIAARRVVVVVAAGVVFAVAVVAGGATGASPQPPACALGKTPQGTPRARVTALIDAQRGAFERSIGGGSAASRDAAGSTFETALDAYVYGFPIVIVRRTIATFPLNQMVSITTLTNADTRTIVAPNHDTLYSVGRIDVTNGPVVIQTPPTGGRYSVIQLTDGFTDAAAYVGDSAPAARDGEVAVVVGPGYHGPLPAGARVIRPETKLLWLLGRTLALPDTVDQQAAAALLSHYSVTPLAAYLAGQRTAPIELPTFPAGSRKPVTVPTGLDFFDELGADLAADPPPARDACAVHAFAAAGIGASLAPSTRATGTTASALRAAVASGPQLISQLVDSVRESSGRHANGWLKTPSDIARFGTDYVERAVVARIGLGANTVDKALYPSTDRDSHNRPLDGAHSYRVRFAPGQTPPVSAFWSLTLYNSASLFYANALNRYAVGDRTSGLKRDPDGGLTIIVSHHDPGPAEQANWLPAPIGRFSLYLRLYEPKPAARTGAWKPPPVIRTSQRELLRGQSP